MMRRELDFFYKVIVKNNDNAKTIIESWNDKYKFEDLAFRHRLLMIKPRLESWESFPLPPFQQFPRGFPVLPNINI